MAKKPQQCILNKISVEVVHMRSVTVNVPGEELADLTMRVISIYFTIQVLCKLHISVIIISYSLEASLQLQIMKNDIL